MIPEVTRENIRGKKVSIVEDHHFALFPWAEAAAELPEKPFILTLDHHTDTLKAFTHYHEVNPGKSHKVLYDWKDPFSLGGALEDMRHDEHFDFAVQNGIISSAAIFSHVNFATNVNPALQIVHFPPEEGAEEEYFSRVLESSFLERNLREISLRKPYILDIDLDVFKGEKSVSPRDPERFFQLVRDAEEITISRERDWVRLLNMDYGKKDFAFFLENVLCLVDKALA